MTMEIYNRMHLIGGLLTISKGKSMTIMVRRMAAGRKHGVRAVAERSSNLIYKLENRMSLLKSSLKLPDYQNSQIS